MPAALAIPAIISAGASLTSAAIGSRASKKAADTQSQAAGDVATSALDTSRGVAGDITVAGADAASGALQAGNTAADEITAAGSKAAEGVTGAAGEANQILKDVYGNAITDTSPYTEAGALGIKSLSDLSNEKFTFSEDDPSYQFRLTEGQKALERSAAARGGLNSGGAMKALTRYAQGVASTEYQSAFDRFLAERGQRAQTLSALAGFGQTGVGQRLAAGQNYGNQASGNLMDAATTAGQFGLGAAESAGGLRYGAAADAGKFKLGSAESAGGIRMQGEQISGDAKMGGANARAAGTIGSANAWATGLGGAANAGQRYGEAKHFADLLGPLIKKRAAQPSNSGEI